MKAPNSTFKKILPGFLFVTSTLVPINVPADAGTCSVESQAAYSGVLSPVYSDRFVAGERNILLNFSAHTGVEEQTTLVVIHQVAQSLWTWGSLSDKDQLARDIRQLLREGAPLISERRENIRRLLELHSEEPFDWVGVESPPGEQMELRGEGIEIATEVRSLLLRKMGNRLSEGEINDLLLLLLGDEDYLFLQGEEFANLPRVPTEDLVLFMEFGTQLFECLDTLDYLASALEGTPYFETLGQISLALHGDGSDKALEIYRQSRDRLAQQLISAEVLDAGNSRYFYSNLEPCEIMFNRERDIYLARQMQENLPTGRGLIFRGTGHRTYLTEEILRLCSNESATGRPLEEDSDEGTE